MIYLSHIEKQLISYHFRTFVYMIYLSHIEKQLNFT